MHNLFVLKKHLGIAALFIALLSFNICCTGGYSRIPEKFYPEEIIKAVKPDKNYIYWAFCRWPADKDTIIYSRGKRPNGLKLDPPLLGTLYQGCMPAWCFNYVITVKDGRTTFITTKENFCKFLGTIENLEEAVLLATATQDLGIDENNRKGGAYMTTANGYNLHLMHYTSCPESRESVLIKIDKDKGVLQKTKLDAYYKGKDCIVY